MTAAGNDERMQVPKAAEQFKVARRIPKRLRLGTLRELRREMANVYADVRRGCVPSQDGARMVFMLDKMRSAVVADELEGRVVALERRDREKTS